VVALTKRGKMRMMGINKLRNFNKESSVAADFEEYPIPGTSPLASESIKQVVAGAHFTLIVTH